MDDTMYPDYLPPEIGIPACAVMLTLYIVSVVKERRATRRVSK